MEEKKQINKHTSWLWVVAFWTGLMWFSLPSAKNPYAAAIDTIAKELNLPVDQLQMVQGSYSVFLLFQSVEIELQTKDSINATIKASLNKWPLGQYTITHYNQTTNHS